MNDYALAGLGHERARSDGELVARLTEVTTHLREFLADLDVVEYLTDNGLSAEELGLVQARLLD